LSDPDTGPRVQRQSRVRLRRPATGVSGAESLSSSDDDESRLSPSRGCFAQDGPLSGDEDALSALSELSEWDMADVVELVDSLEASEDSVETEASMSECARVYLTVVMSSSSGVRKDTRFSAGNMGREAAILRGIMARSGLLASTEARLCGCL
jgi:hypothetical protein